MRKALDMEKDDLFQIEEAALNAWPAPRQILFDGWLLRFTGGNSKRVNSVNPLYPSTLPLVEKISACEALYAQQGLPCLFRISDIFDPMNLKPGLKDAGYTAFDPTYVLGRPLVMANEHHPDVTILEMPTQDWFRMREHFIKVPPADRQAHAAILSSVVPEKVLMGLFIGSRPVACGMGVVQGSLLGFFSIYTGARWRRKGYARMVMAALSDWGNERGATYGYLQVEGYNRPALALYKKLGYTQLYSYEYYKKVSGN